MRYAYLATAALLGMTVVSALAQAPPMVDTTAGARPGHVAGIGASLPRSDKASNIGSADTRSSIAPTLPASEVDEDAGPYDYLRAARAALVAGRTGQAQQSLEMAETRSLDRSVARGQVAPIDSRFVSRIQDARHALGDGDSAHAIELIDLALAG
jgi:hypothetical protein